MGNRCHLQGCQDSQDGDHNGQQPGEHDRGKRDRGAYDESVVIYQGPQDQEAAEGVDIGPVDMIIMEFTPQAQMGKRLEMDRTF
jgi:hypothetical protein